MARNAFLATRLRELFLNGTWIANTNYKEQVTNLDWQNANKKIGGLNSIAALTYHINYYLDGLLRAFENGKIDISDKYSFDVPEIKSGVDWEKLVHELLTNAEKFALYIENMDDCNFDEPFVEEKYGTLWRNVEGVIEHSYYHLGQIVLIKKLILSS